MIKSISPGVKKTYVGYTNNLKSRVEKHNSNKGAKSTKGYLWELIYKRRFLKKRITSEIANFEDKKLKIKKITNKETQVISGPYTSINLLKNDYIKLKNFGFEELDIFIND